jgi:hypothetical protein
MYGSDNVLGETSFISNGNVTVANMFAQNGLITDAGNHKPLNYYSLVKCMEYVKDYTHEKYTYDIIYDIYCPKFGSGLSGGDWNIIEEFINDIWVKSNINVNVCVL